MSRPVEPHTDIIEHWACRVFNAATPLLVFQRFHLWLLSDRLFAASGGAAKRK